MVNIFYEASHRIRARELLDLAGAAHPSKDWIRRVSNMARLRHQEDQKPKIGGSRERVAKTLRWLGRTPTPEMIERYRRDSG